MTAHLVVISLRHCRFVFERCVWRRRWRCSPVSCRCFVRSVKWFLWTTGLLCFVCVLLFAVRIVSFSSIPHRASPTLGTQTHAHTLTGKQANAHTSSTCWTMISFQEKEVREKKNQLTSSFVYPEGYRHWRASRQGGCRTPQAFFYSMANSVRLTCKMHMHEFRVCSALDAA